MGVWWGVRGDEICNHLRTKDGVEGEKVEEGVGVPNTEGFQMPADETAGKIDPELSGMSHPTEHTVIVANLDSGKAGSSMQETEHTSGLRLNLLTLEHQFLSDCPPLCEFCRLGCFGRFLLARQGRRHPVCCLWCLAHRLWPA
jgi:hypothetical protein